MAAKKLNKSQTEGLKKLVKNEGYYHEGRVWLFVKRGLLVLKPDMPLCTAAAVRPFKLSAAGEKAVS